MEMEESYGLSTKERKSYTYSDLNEDIIHHILSFLKRREAIKTSLLCKAWRQAWMSYPVLKFDDTELLPNTKDFAYTHKDFTELISRIVGDSMGTFVSNRNACGTCNKPVMQKFHLSLFGNTCIKYSLIEKWVSMALESRVQDLFIQRSNISKEDLCTPKTVFSAKFLRSLALVGMKVPRLQIGDVDLYSLTSLTIYAFSIPIDTHTLQSILLKCPLLENLQLRCSSVTKIKISNLRNLKMLKVLKFEEVEIANLPRLDSVFIRLHPTHLMNLCIDDTQNIKYLYLEVTPLGGTTNTWFRKYLWKFSSVERLRVRSFCGLEFHGLWLPKIKNIYFDLVLSRLCQQSIIHEGEIFAPPFSFTLSPVPWASIKAFVLTMHPIDEKNEVVTRYWISIWNRNIFSLNQKLRHHLSNVSQNCTTLSISIIERKWDGEGSLNLHGEPACVVKELGLHKITTNPLRYLAILRDLFSTCHPIILYTMAAKELKDFIKCMCEGFIGRGDGEYWQQQLIDAKVERIMGRKRVEGYGPMELDALINLLPSLKGCYKIYFRLRWLA